MEPQPLTSKTRVGNPKMRPLVIDDEARAAAARVRDYAEHPEALYQPLKDGVKSPGDNPAHVALINTYRCVYSITDTGANRYRHMSISVPGEHYPNHYAVMELATLFGFTGWGDPRAAFPKDWMVDVNKEERCVVLAQALPGSN